MVDFYHAAFKKYLQVLLNDKPEKPVFVHSNLASTRLVFNQRFVGQHSLVTKSLLAELY